MIQFFWNDKLISNHKTKKEAFLKALAFLKRDDQNFGFWKKYSCSFLDTTDQESESQLCREFDSWIWDNYKTDTSFLS